MCYVHKMGWLISNPWCHVVLISLCCLLFIHDYKELNEYQCTFINHKNNNFRLLESKDVVEISTTDDYETLLNLKSFKFLLNPKQMCDSDRSLLLVCIVTSKASNAARRHVIRTTWGRVAASMRLVFLVGEGDEKTQERVKRENVIHRDIVQGSFLDAYRNLTYKNVMGLKWAAHHCRRARYVLKTDDDVVVNARALRRFLARNLSPWGSQGLLACEVKYNTLASRDKFYKWMVTQDEYSGTYYPTYCLGFVILYSMDVVVKLLEESPKEKFFWIDDVFITGLLAERINVNHTSFYKYILNEGKFVLRQMGTAYTDQFLFSGPNLQPEKMKSLWKAIST